MMPRRLPLATPVLMLAITFCAMATLPITACSEDKKSPAADSLLAESSEAETKVLLEVTSELPAIDPGACRDEGTPGATAACLSPTKSPEYYVEQGLKYFDTLDVDADPESVPNYSELVARWEWPPWLKLTGFDKETMISTSVALKQWDPSTVPVRDCRFFEVQPFCRCYISFDYEGKACPIYEEFTFNDQGQMTFIEAWSDLPGFLPQDPEQDPWAETAGYPRLSTRVPGLGNAEGLIDLSSEWMHEAEAQDPDVADFAMRARDQWRYWGQELKAAGEDLYERGCGW